MNKHYLNYAEEAIKNYWSMPAFTNYGKNTFTFGQVAENIEKLHILLQALPKETRLYSAPKTRPNGPPHSLPSAHTTV